MNTSTNLLFLLYGGLPRDDTSKLLQGGGGLIQGSRDIMGIKSSRAQKIWELTQEFDDSPEQKKIFSNNLYNEVPPAPPRPKVASQGNSTPQLGEKTSQKALENLQNGFKNLLGLLTPEPEGRKAPIKKPFNWTIVNEGGKETRNPLTITFRKGAPTEPVVEVVEELKTPVRKPSEPRNSSGESPSLARRLAAWTAIEQKKNLTGTPPTPPTARTMMLRQSKNK